MIIFKKRNEAITENIINYLMYMKYYEIWLINGIWKSYMLFDEIIIWLICFF